jgi:hypothetical protein
VPPYNGLWLDENQRLPPSTPEPPQDHPEQFIWGIKPRRRTPLFQDGELLPKSQIFQEQITARAKKTRKKNSLEPQQAQHKTSLTRE